MVQGHTDIEDFPRSTPRHMVGTIDFARYELIDTSTRGKWVNWHPPQIPHTARLEFTQRKSDEIPTSWDILAAITVSAEVPEIISQEDADGHHDRIIGELLDDSKSSC